MKKDNLLWGLIFLTTAAIIILNQLYDTFEIGIFGIIITIFMAGIIIKSIKPLHFAGILFPLAIIIIIYDEPFGLTDITPFPVLIAALFGSIGLEMIFGRFTHKSHQYFEHDKHETTIENDDANNISACANFSSCIKYANSEDFKQADLKCSFGSLNVYFDNAKLSETGAKIYIDVSFGGSELYIPKDWNVIIKASTSFGAITEKNGHPNNTSSHEVIIDGHVSFGGVDIYYV